MNVLAGRRQAAAEPIIAPAPPRFLERLPAKLRGAEIWAVQSEDHYLRLHTSLGQELILMRLSDAVAELEGVEGVGVNRFTAQDIVRHPMVERIVRAYDADAAKSGRAI